MLDVVSDFLKMRDVEFLCGASMSRISTMRIEATAAVLAYPDSTEKLCAMLSYFSDNRVPYVLVGGGSNILPSKDAYDGVIVKTDRIGTKSLAENICTLECGARFGGAMSEYARLSLGGAEGLIHIPGCVGGMVCSNAGAFGYEIADIFLDGLFYRIKDGQTVKLSRDDMDFSYRHSVLAKREYCLLSARFRLVHKPYAEIRSEVAEYAKRRRESQPMEYPSLGSVFKRVDGISAGYYIDKAGMKGCRIGGAEVSTKHAGFIVNRGGATPKDVLRLIEVIKERVYSVFGVELCEEIVII